MVRLLQNQRLRLAIAGALLLVVAFAIHPYFINTVSYSAFVNAELTRISSPIGGAIARSLPADGEYIPEDRTFRLLETIAPDRHRLAELEQQRATTLERLSLARSHLASIEAREAALAARAGGFTGYAQAITVQDALLYDAELTTCRVDEQRLREELTRSRRLAETGAAPRLSVTLAQSDLDAQSARCGAAEARLERARIKQQAALQEIFLEDGFNDAPYSVQELDRLFLRRLDIEGEVAEAEVLERELVGLIAQERERLELATRYVATLPANHVVWSVPASEGDAVTEGQTLIELADCSRRFVSVLLSERAVGSIGPGDGAAVRLVGSSSWVRGRVTSISGSAARRDVQLLAAESPEPSPRRFLVEVTLPATAIKASDNNRCNLGRLAEVRFHRFRLAPPIEFADTSASPPAGAQTPALAGAPDPS
jgi:multidrug resistance efflux pump